MAGPRALVHTFLPSPMAPLSRQPRPTPPDRHHKVCLVEHGQGYVAAGRTQAAEDTGAFVNDECCVPRTGGDVPVPVMAATCIPQLLARE